MLKFLGAEIEGTDIPENEEHGKSKVEGASEERSRSLEFGVCVAET